MSPISNVKQFIVDEFLPDTDASQLDEGLDLIEAGIVDSLGVLKIVAAIESQLKLTIEPELLQPEYYRSVMAIESLIAGRRAPAAVA